MGKTLAELQEQKNKLEAMIARQQKEETARLEARNTVQEALNKTSYTLADLFPEIVVRGGRKTRAVKAGGLYQDPDNAENTWGGRGRMPLWLTEKIANGSKVEDFQVAN